MADGDDGGEANEEQRTVRPETQRSNGRQDFFQEAAAVCLLMSKSRRRELALHSQHSFAFLVAENRLNSPA